MFVNGILICTYIADFTYTRDGKYIVEDFKGVLTDVFKLKRKLMKAIFNIDILISRKPTAYSEIGERKKK
jgi:hypothetical protein